MEFIVKQGNTNTICSNTWRSLLFELLLSKQIVKKTLKNHSIPENCTIKVFKRDSALAREYSTFFDILIRIINNDTNEENDIFVVIGNFRFVENCDNAVAISVYRHKENISIEELVYSSTNKRAKIVFSYFRKCDRRQVFAQYVSDKDMEKLPFYTINNLELPFDKFLKILYKRLNNNKNKIARDILANLMLLEKCDMEMVAKNLNIDIFLVKRSFRRLLKRFSYLKRFLIIENSTITVKEK